MNELHQKNPFRTFIMTLLILATVGTSFLFWRDMNKLNDAYADIMQVEAISSTTQRQINLASNGDHLQRDVFVINETTTNALSIQGEDEISLLSDPTIALLANEVLQEWLVIEGILSYNWNLAEGEEKKDLDTISLSLARDAHFKAMTDLSNGIGNHTTQLSGNITQYQLVVMILIFLIAMIAINSALQTRAELMISKVLAEKAQIDAATGLYNRSRCQEIFKGNQSIVGQRTPAIMVFDLNDLKKTNDNLGHRVGDELIGAFAHILKKGCDVHSVPPFIGRYGGDEFVVYYDDLPNPAEIEIYIKELEFLTKEHNERETRYQVSYAVGYAAIAKDTTEKLTARQLFDKADEAMYVNKEAMKRAKNPNYDEEKARGETR